MIMKRTLLLLVFGLVAGWASAQTNVMLLHQLVEENKKEHALQLEARDAQAKAEVQEEANKTLMEKVRKGYQTIQSRFSEINFLIDAVGIGSAALPLIQSIAANQSVIFEECQRNPALIPLALATEQRFINQSESLLSFLVGLSSAVAELHQMANSDRRLLFQHVIDELSEINNISKGVVVSLKADHGRQKASGLFPTGDDDIALMEDVINNVNLVKE